MNGAVDSASAATLALLADTARSGRGGMYGEGGYAGGAYASPSANAVRIDSGNRSIENGVENLLDQNQFTATNKNIVDGDARTCDKLTQNANRAADQSTNLEFRTSDRLRDIERELVSNAKDAAKCCCDAQLTAAVNHGQVLAKMEEIDARGIERSLHTANAELTSLKTQIACGCNCK